MLRNIRVNIRTRTYASRLNAPQDGKRRLSPWRKRFPEDPVCPTLVVKQQVRRTKSVRPPNAARDVLVYVLRYVYYVTYITYITLRFVNFRKDFS